MDKIIKVAIVEDDDDIRNSVSQILKNAQGISLKGVYANAEDCIRSISNELPDVILMDIQLPKMNGIECVKIIKNTYPNIQFLMCTVFENDDIIFDSICAGANGYILKMTSQEEMIKAIHDIYNGGSPISPLIARKVIQAFNKMNAPSAEYLSLSIREREILDYLSKGYRYKEIGSILNISTETVRTHIRNIYDKLQVQSRTEAINKAFKK